MFQRGGWWGIAPACWIGLLVCGACAVGSTAGLSEADYVPAEVQFGAAHPVVSESQVDALDRFLSTVRVDTAFLLQAEGVKLQTCSGVLIHPRVVLTAGHCVCRERKSVPPEAGDTTFIDAATCAQTAGVTLFRYAATGESPPALRGSARRVIADEVGPLEGRVHPHDDLRIVYRQVATSAGMERATEFSRADLALIVLDQPLPREVKPMRLAERPVELRESVVLVGYGPAHPGRPIGQQRVYGENEVASIREDGETFHIGRQLEIAPSYEGEKPKILRRRGSYALSGDSGGPCLRERRGTLELVGIAKSTHAPPFELSSYTSTYKYRDWLRGKISQALTQTAD
jgi:hypothetical protein